MIFCFAVQARALIIFSVAIAVSAAVLPADAGSIDQNVNSTRTTNARAAANSVKAASDEHTLVANPVWAIPLSKLSATRDRPIFSPSRRPPPLPSPPAIAKLIEPSKPTGPENPPFTLVGTVAGEHSGLAVFVEQAKEAVVKLHVNESYKGWILRSIKGREVELQKAGKSSVLALAPPGSGSGPASAQAYLEPTRVLPRRARRGEE